jgi:hypothetical protein
VGLCCRVATGSSDAALGRELAEHGVYARKRWEWRRGGEANVVQSSRFTYANAVSRGGTGTGPEAFNAHPLHRATIGSGCRGLSW